MGDARGGCSGTSSSRRVPPRSSFSSIATLKAVPRRAARAKRNFRKIAKTPSDGEVSTFPRDLIKTFASFVPSPRTVRGPNRRSEPSSFHSVQATRTDTFDRPDLILNS